MHRKKNRHTNLEAPWSELGAVGCIDRCARAASAQLYTQTPLERFVGVPQLK